MDKFYVKIVVYEVLLEPCVIEVFSDQLKLFVVL